MVSEGRRFDLGNAPVRKLFWAYAIPSLLSMIAQTTAGLVDSFFLGRFVGPEGLSAVALFFPAIGVLVGISAMFAVGGTTQAGIELGKGNYAESNNSFNVTVFFLFLTGMTLGAAIVILSPHLPGFVGASGITGTYLSQYAAFLGPFAPLFVLNFAFMFFLKLDGKPVFVVVTVLGGTVINIFLDYLLVAKFQWEVRGAALATGFSQLVPWIILVSAIVFKSRWKFRWPQFHVRTIGAMLFNGSSELMSNVAVSLSGMVINLMIMKRLGVTGIAAYAVALQVAYLASSLGYGFSESSQGCISFNYGAGKSYRVRAFRRMTLLANMVTGIMLFGLSFFGGRFLAGFFVSEPVTWKLAVYILKFYAFAFLFSGANTSFGTYYTAINDPVRSGLITLYRSLVGLVIGLLIFPFLMGNNGMWIALVFAEFSCFVIGQVMIMKNPLGRGRQGIVHHPVEEERQAG